MRTKKPAEGRVFRGEGAWEVGDEVMNDVSVVMMGLTAS